MVMLDTHKQYVFFSGQSTNLPDLLDGTTEHVSRFDLGLLVNYNEAELADIIGESMVDANTGVIILPSNLNDDVLDLALVEREFSFYFLVIQAIAKCFMSNKKGGEIIIISSASGCSGHAVRFNSPLVYSAINGLTKSLAKEVTRFNISVNSILLGNCQKLGFSIGLSAIQQQSIKPHHIGNNVKLESIAQCIRFLSGAGMSITGQFIHLDNGLII